MTLVAGGVLHSTAFAQARVGAAKTFGSTAADASVDLFTRNRNVSVRQRPRPDYEALGVRAGRFLIYPKIEIAGEFNDNIYAVASGEVSDAILHLRPELAAESD